MNIQLMNYDPTADSTLKIPKAETADKIFVVHVDRVSRINVKQRTGGCLEKKTAD
jgi:hypothetical protein